MNIFQLSLDELLSVCTESQLDSLSLTNPRKGQNTQIKKFLLCFYTLLEASGSNGRKTKGGSFFV